MTDADTIRQALSALDRERQLLDGRDYNKRELRRHLRALDALLAERDSLRAENERLREAGERADELAACLALWEHAVGVINMWPSRCRAAMKGYRLWRATAETEEER